VRFGTYHNVSKKYLPLFLPVQFRNNNRNNPDIFWETDDTEAC